MKHMWLRGMSLLVFACFFIACGAVDFCHDHEPDDESHDLCPACQWNNLHQDDYSGEGEIYGVLKDGITFIGTRTASPVLFLLSDFNKDSILTRGPPASA